jgi:hypothetical protein
VRKIVSDETLANGWGKRRGRLTESSTSASGRTRHFVGFTTSSEFSLRVRGSLHVGELVRTFLGEIIVTSSDHDLGFSAQDGVASDFDGLKGGSASSDGDLDRTGRREKEKVDPSSDSVDETSTTTTGFSIEDSSEEK